MNEKECAEKLLPIIDLIPDTPDAVERLEYTSQIDPVKMERFVKKIDRLFARILWWQKVLHIENAPYWLVQLTPMWLVRLLT